MHEDKDEHGYEAWDECVYEVEHMLSPIAQRVYKCADDRLFNISIIFVVHLRNQRVYSNKQTARQTL